MKISESIILMCLCLAQAASVHAGQTPGTCLSDEEARMLQLVNDYRAENGLSRVAWSKSLSTVGQWHALDVVTNFAAIFPAGAGCNLHSWSNWKPSLWTGMCYKDDHSNSALMWSKPKEITNNVYLANGYELGGYNYVSAADALAGWKASSGHNNVLLNRGVWAPVSFKAMGVGIDPVNKYYYLWFGSSVDPQGEMPLCKPPLFIDGFEP